MYSTMLIKRLVRSATRQLHVISRETIKPASSTPPQLKYYNLSLLDQFGTQGYVPAVLFYPNHRCDSSGKIAEHTLRLKNSLSQALNLYYPLAGRFMSGAYVHCNDEGVEFSEIRFKCGLTEFLDNPDYGALAPLCPATLAGDDKYKNSNPLLVQLNHFDCGGIAITACLSHNIADACTLFTFLTYWASVFRECSSGEEVSLHFIGTPGSSPTSDSLSVDTIEFEGKDCVTRRFFFKNSKIDNLKAVVAESGVQNPSRVQVLASLLYKCAIAAAGKRSSASFRPSVLIQPVNMRPHIVPPLPENSFGNFCLGIIVSTSNENDVNLITIADELKKGMMPFKGMKIPHVNEWLSTMREPMLEGAKQLYENQHNLMVYHCSSLCRFPINEADFGQGKPVRATLGGCLPKNTFYLLDARSGDGIEALVTLEEEDMNVFQLDKELLAFGSSNQSH